MRREGGGGSSRRGGLPKQTASADPRIAVTAVASAARPVLLNGNPKGWLGPNSQLDASTDQTGSTGWRTVEARPA